jgi:chemotaxis response regulator CheB
LLASDWSLTVAPSRAPLTVMSSRFKSASKAYGNHVIRVILTGFLSGETVALRAGHVAGELTKVQSAAEAEYPICLGMR